MPAQVPKECPVAGCTRDFLSLDEPSERLAQVKQHLYQDHMDEMSQDEIVEVAEGLPSLTEL